MDTSPDMEVPSHRACAHCRSQKVRCIPDESNADVCQRCARSGRPCVFTPLQKRKQRKRTDTRVAELEREMRTMRALLKKKQEGAGGGTALAEREESTGRPFGLWFKENTAEAPPVGQDLEWNQTREEQDIQHLLPAGASYSNSSVSQLWPNQYTRHPFQDTRDVVETGVCTMAIARQLYATYRDLFQHYPIVAVPDDITADQMRAVKPTLFLAIIAAAAGKENSELSATLDQEVLHAYATRSMVNSEKSLELVQALLVSAVWYHPPQKFGQLKYYEYTHMAATMAMDIGIGTRPTPRRSRFGTKPSKANPTMLKHSAEDASNPDLSMAPRVDEMLDTASVESRRTFLGCFIICAGISLSLRRPNMLRASSYMKDCVKVLEQSPIARPSDRTLVAWVKLVMIAEEICVSFSYDDPGSIASLAELRTQLMLRDFQKRLTAWWTSVPEVDTNGTLTIMYYTIRLYLHELALHIEHSPDDFKAPYQMGLIQPYDGPEIPTQILAEAIAECITCAHALCNTFTSMDVDGLRCLPVFSYVRVSFATFILAKLCLSATHPSSRIARVLDRSSLKVEIYMDRMILHVRNIVGPTRCRVPAIFLALLFKLRQWCLNPEMIANTEPEPEPELSEVSEEPAKTYSRHRREGSRIAEESSTEESPDDSNNNISVGLPIVTESFDHPSKRQHSLDYAEYITSNNPPPSASASTSQHLPTKKKSAPTSNISSSSTAPLQQPQQHYAPQLQPTSDQMELDKDFMELWNDMNGLPEGGLTGLEDWSQLSTDMMGFTGMSDMSSWPNLGDGMMGMMNGMSGGNVNGRS